MFLSFQAGSKLPFYANLARQDLHINNTLQPFPAKQSLFVKKCLENELHKLLG